MNDFLNLANATRPQMMGNAPMGAGGMAGLDYAMQRQQQQGFLDKAAQLAELEAKRKASEAEADGPLKDMERKKKMLEATFAVLGPHSNAWQAAKTPEEKAEILSMIEADPNIPDGFKKRIQGQPQERLDRIMGAVWNARTNTPGQQNKIDLEGKKGENSASTARIRNQGKLESDILRIMGAASMQEAKLKAQKEIAQAKAATPTKEKPLTSDQLFAKNLERLYPDDPETQANEYLKSKIYNAQAPLQAKAAAGQAIGLPVQSPPSLKITPPKGQSTSSPKQDTAPQKQEQKPTTVNVNDLESGKTFNGRVITKVVKNKVTGERVIALDNGEIYSFNPRK